MGSVPADEASPRTSLSVRRPIARGMSSVAMQRARVSLMQAPRALARQGPADARGRFEPLAASPAWPLRLQAASRRGEASALIGQLAAVARQQVPASP